MLPLYHYTTELYALLVIKYFSFFLVLTNDDEFRGSLIIYRNNRYSCIHTLIWRQITVRQLTPNFFPHDYNAHFKNLAFFIDFIYSIQYVITCLYPSYNSQQATLCKKSLCMSNLKRIEISQRKERRSFLLICFLNYECQPLYAMNYKKRKLSRMHEYITIFTKY